MSRNLVTIPTSPFIGTPYSQPTANCRRLQTEAPKVVSINIDWSLYGVTGNVNEYGVSVNLVGQAVQAPLDKIRGIYIDNTFSVITLYVKFPDTGFTVVCPPGGYVVTPVFTNVQEAIIFGTDFRVGNIPTSTIHFVNIDLQGFYVPASQVSDFIERVTISKETSAQFNNVASPVSLPVTLTPPADDRFVLVSLILGDAATLPEVTGVTLDTINLPKINGIGGSVTGGIGEVSIWGGLLPLGNSPQTLEVFFSGPASLDGLYVRVYCLSNLASVATRDSNVFGTIAAQTQYTVLNAPDNSAIFSCSFGSGNVRYTNLSFDGRGDITGTNRGILGSAYIENGESFDVTALDCNLICSCVLA